MKVFVTGATGYLGGSVASGLLAEGHEVVGLVRSAEKANIVKKLGIEPVIGTLESRDVLEAAARSTDATINAASSDHRHAVEALLDALAGSGKVLLHTSGSSIVCDDALGDSENPKIYEDDTPFQPLPSRKERVSIDQMVRSAGVYRGIRAAVICPTMVYGRGRGATLDSDQIPKMTAKAKQRGTGVHVGRGLNRWSNVFIGDLVALYSLALAKAPSASFFFAENGEESLKSVASAISVSLGFGGLTESWAADEAIAEYGQWARFAIATNSRVRAKNARALLGWTPAGPALKDVLERGL